ELTRRIMAGVFTNATRALLTRAARWGMLRGPFAVSVRFESKPDISLESRLREAASRADVLSTELGTVTRPVAPAVLSAEQQLRGPDKSVTAAALVETTSEQEARAVAATLRRMLGTRSHIGIYQLFCMLDKA